MALEKEALVHVAGSVARGPAGVPKAMGGRERDRDRERGRGRGGSREREGENDEGDMMKRVEKRNQ
jgi:hypothetical protein